MTDNDSELPIELWFNSDGAAQLKRRAKAVLVRLSIAKAGVAKRFFNQIVLIDRHSNMLTALVGIQHAMQHSCHRELTYEFQFQAEIY
jgi:hypothetical protein